MREKKNKYKCTLRAQSYSETKNIFIYYFPARLHNLWYLQQQFCWRFCSIYQIFLREPFYNLNTKWSPLKDILQIPVLWFTCEGSYFQSFPWSQCHGIFFFSGSHDETNNNNKWFIHIEFVIRNQLLTPDNFLVGSWFCFQLPV